MKTKNHVAYYRVSTKKQNGDMDAQRTAVKNYLKNYYPPMASFTEIESGAKNDRPELAKALAYCKKHKATLVVAKLDRLSRSLKMIASLQEDGDVPFVCADCPDANRDTIAILGIFARKERELISSRTKEALYEKKKKGVKLGWHNPKIKAGLENYWLKHKKKAPKTKLKKKKVKIAIPSKRELADEAVLPTLKALRLQGLSYEKVAEGLNKTGIKTRWGKLWTQKQVIRVAHRNKLK